MAGLAEDLAGGLDRTRFALSCGLQPDEVQRAVLRARSRFVAVCTSRQWGKTTSAGLLGASDAWYDVVHPAARAVLGPRAHALVLIVSPSQRQSDETFARVKAFLGARVESVQEESVKRESDLVTFARQPGSQRITRVSDIAREWKVRSCMLHHGARVVSLPGAPETIRGFASVTRVIVDEAGFVPRGLIGAVRPMLLVSRGCLTMLSSPNGRVGDFADAFLDPEVSADFERYTVPWQKNPRISAEDIAKVKRGLPHWLFAQEYECEFTETLGSVFADRDIVGALVEESTWSF